MALLNALYRHFYRFLVWFDSLDAHSLHKWNACCLTNVGADVRAVPEVCPQMSQTTSIHVRLCIRTGYIEAWMHRLAKSMLLNM